MRSFSAILPGARVRTDDGFLGTVERLDHHWAESGDQPDRMIVRSEDGRWRYSIPLMFVHSVNQGAFQPVVYIAMNPDELIHYIYEAIPPQSKTPSPSPSAPQPATANPPSSDEQADTPGGRPKRRRQAELTDTAVQPPSGASEPPTVVTGSSDDTGVLKLPVYEEELFVHKRPVVLGKLHVHMGVESEERHVSLPVYHEEAIVDHVPPDQYDPAQARKNPNEVYIPVVEEQLVVQKQMVVKEYLRVRKHLLPEQHEVNETVRHETVRITAERQPNTPPHVRLIRSAPADLYDADVADQPTVTNLTTDDLQAPGASPP